MLSAEILSTAAQLYKTSRFKGCLQQMHDLESHSRSLEIVRFDRKYYHFTMLKVIIVNHSKMLPFLQYTVHDCL